MDCTLSTTHIVLDDEAVGLCGVFVSPAAPRYLLPQRDMIFRVVLLIIVPDS